MSDWKVRIVPNSMFIILDSLLPLSPFRVKVAKE